MMKYRSVWGDCDVCNSELSMPATESSLDMKVDDFTSRSGFDSRLKEIVQKVIDGRRLSADDGLLLYETPDLWTVGQLADLVRCRLHGDRAYYNINRHLNYSNICALSCTFCSFYRKQGQEGAYEYSLDQVRQEAQAAVDAGATEMHIVGGLHPTLPFDYYLDMLRVIRETAPLIHIKAFTAVEIVHFARISRRGREGEAGIRAVLEELREAGLGSLPGGGAEVFDDRVHDEAFKGKIRSDQWLTVHRVAHELGINTNATMLYGHIEQRADRIQHLVKLRSEQERALHQWAVEQNITLQDEQNGFVLTGPDELYPRDRLPRAASAQQSGYFQTIIPLPFVPDDSELSHLPGPTGQENFRTIAIARLMLDNFPHVKAFWIMYTLEMAQIMLRHGADDIDGTVMWYDITKVSGDDTHQEVSVWDLEQAIREAGLQPIERDTLYRPVKRDGRTWQIAEE